MHTDADLYSPRAQRTHAAVQNASTRIMHTHTHGRAHGRREEDDDDGGGGDEE